MDDACAFPAQPAFLILLRCGLRCLARVVGLRFYAAPITVAIDQNIAREVKRRLSFKGRRDCPLR